MVRACTIGAQTSGQAQARKWADITDEIDTQSEDIANIFKPPSPRAAIDKSTHMEGVQPSFFEPRHPPVSPIFVQGYAGNFLEADDVEKVLLKRNHSFSHRTYSHDLHQYQ